MTGKTHISYRQGNLLIAEFMNLDEELNAENIRTFLVDGFWRTPWQLPYKKRYDKLLGVWVKIQEIAATVASFSIERYRILLHIGIDRNDIEEVYRVCVQCIEELNANKPNGKD